jgi:hypothetical protein
MEISLNANTEMVKEMVKEWYTMQMEISLKVSGEMT